MRHRLATTLSTYPSSSATTHSRQRGKVPGTCRCRVPCLARPAHVLTALHLNPTPSSRPDAYDENHTLIWQPASEMRHRVFADSNAASITC
jgi:hypothetical protein